MDPWWLQLTMMMQWGLGWNMDQMACASFQTCKNLHKTYQRWKKAANEWEKWACASFSGRSVHKTYQKCHKKEKGMETHSQIIKNINPPTMVRKDNWPQWIMSFNQWSKNSCKDGEKREEKKDSDGNKGPPKVVNTVLSSSQSQTSSIDIGEFGMRAVKQGNAATFSWAVKLSLFKHVKFYRDEMHHWTSTWMREAFADSCISSVVFLKVMPSSGGANTEPHWETI